VALLFQGNCLSGNHLEVTVKELPATYRFGYLSVEQDLKAGMHKGEIGIQIAEDGRIWICLDGQALIRFRPDVNYRLGKEE
jgi:sugar lactone lactonase YvrE